MGFSGHIHIYDYYYSKVQMHSVVLHLMKKDEMNIDVLFAPSAMYHIKARGKKEVVDDRKKERK